MTWCENGADYVFGLPGTQPLSKKVADKADEVRVERALENKDIVRGYAETRHRAGSAASGAPSRLSKPRLSASISASSSPISNAAPPMDLRQPVLRAWSGGDPIKLHKTQLSSDRTSCRSAVANQVRPSCTPPPIG